MPLYIAVERRGNKYKLIHHCKGLYHGVFRRLRTATKGTAFGIRKPFEKGLRENFN